MKKLIIVCEENLIHYGDFLAQLISSSDDAENQIIGLKDGIAAAQVWTEKEYMSNAVQISSEQYILFIGNSKLIMEKRMHMQKKYSEYGMNYGWLGKQGALFVDRVVSYGEYEEFYKLLNSSSVESNQPEAMRLIEVGDEHAISVIEDAENVTDECMAETTKIDIPTQKESKFKKFIGPIADNTKAAIRKTADFGVKQFIKVSDDIAIAKNRKDIEKQEYTCLVLMFYLKDLSAFLGLNEA